jgi:hypothetical protein
VRRFLIFVLFAALLDERAVEAAHLTYGWQNVDGVNVFFREGGPPSSKSLVNYRRPATQ